MKRLFVLLAVSSMGTGCVVSDTCDFRTVSIGWPSFALANGGITSSCGTAGASTVDVYMGSALVGNVDCTAGGVNVLDVPAGTHTFTVEALDGSGNIILRDSFGTSGDGCGTLLRDTQPAEGYVDLVYDFYEGATPLPANQDLCAASSQLWLNITDTVANVNAYRYVSAGTAPLCESTQRTLRLPLPVGTFRLDWMEERVGSTLTASDCVPKTFGVDWATATPKAVQLDTLGSACAH